jgi:hypothetical protein
MIYNCKKMLHTLHLKLIPLLTITELGQSDSLQQQIWLGHYSQGSNAKLYKTFFDCLLSYFQISWERYHDLKQVAKNLQKHIKHLFGVHRTLRSNSDSITRDIPGILPLESKGLLERYGFVNADHELPGSEKEDAGFYRNAKCIFTLFVLHDPLIYKLIGEVHD